VTEPARADASSQWTLAVAIGAGLLLAAVSAIVLVIEANRGPPPRTRPPFLIDPSTAPAPPPPEPPAPVTEEPEADDPAPVASAAPRIDLRAEWKKIDAAIVAEDYPTARRLLAGLPSTRNAKETKRRAEVSTRLEALAAFRTAAIAALTASDAALARDDPLAALERLKTAVPKDGAWDTPTGRRLVAAIDAVTRRCRELGIDPSVPVHQLSAERIAALDSAVLAGAERVAALRARLADEKAAAAAGRTAALEQAKKASTERPLTLQVVPGLKLEKAVVTALDAERFALSAGGDEVAFAWDAVEPAIALRIRRLGLREDQPGDLVAHGLWCVGRRLFDEAKKAFKRAQALDPALRTPDVDRLERASRVWNGSFERRGGTIELRYAFDQPNHGADWPAFTPGVGGGVTDGKLLVRGTGVFLVGLQDVGFTQTVDVQASLEKVTSPTVGGAVGVSFAAGTPREETWLAVVFPASGSLAVCRLKGKGGLEIVERVPDAFPKGGGGKSVRVRLVIRNERLEVQAKGTTVASVRVDPPWEKVRVLVGGAGQGAASVSVTDVVVTGRVRFDWLRKAFGEFEESLATALARAEDLPSLRRPEGRPPERPLSAEEPEVVVDVPADATAAYQAALKLLTAASAEDPRPALEAYKALGKILEKHRGHAAAWYRRGDIALQLGYPGLALGDLERAARALPRFHEAVAARSRALSALGRLPAALAAADEALRLAPGSSEAWGALGEARFLAGDLGGALEAHELALALDPWDGEARAKRRNVSHVLLGPPWSRRFRAETAHYVVETNIGQRRCDEYAADLEVVRAQYCKRFGAVEEAKEPERSKVLVFDTEEGYHGYAALTIDDRIESSCGVYLPRYRQLLLFEGKDDATRTETRQVLFHEGFHQFLHGLVPDAAVPYWLNEGLAEFHSAVTVTNGEVVAEAQLLPARLQNLRMFLAKGGPFPFEKLMKESPAEFYSGLTWAKYAQAWSMVHFFETGADAKLRERFRLYVQKIREGATGDEAFAAAWAGVKWPEVQKAWRAHVDGMKLR
jgi:tetratricopeptide (TPR) repeat protein